MTNSRYFAPIGHQGGVYQVALPQSLQQTHEWVADLAEVLQQQQPFVMVYPNVPMPEGEGESVDSRKVVTLWLKQHKPSLVELCKGMVLTCDDTPAAVAEYGQLLPMLQAVYGVPVSLTQQWQHTLDQAEALLPARV